ncbi:MAG: hypothetical protein ACI4C0_00600 [Lachnospiraceae bacterium]
MKQIFVIYDDSKMPGKEIKTITGAKSYGETIFKRVTLKDRMEAEIVKEKQVLTVFNYKGEKDNAALFAALPLDNNTTIVHLYSNFGLKDTKAFSVLLKKAEFMNESYTAFCDNKPAMSFLAGADSYKKAFDALIAGEYEAERIENDAFMDLSVRANFLTFITGGFDARFFNALAGDEYTVTKRSTKKEKIKAEYQFYYLLPETMKMWFVMPYDYKEDADGASYTMERFHMTDIAIRFVHGAVDEDELKDILDKLFYFINLRATKEVSSDVGKAVAKELYIDKLAARMEELKKYKEYEQFDSMIKMGTSYDGIADVVSKYEKLYEKLAMANNRNYGKLAVGHGDLCFSNILYSKEAEILKLIDPKGALQEEELYTDPYYDLAKLSHSICGCYDFFNSGLYEISIKRDLKLDLTIDTDNTSYKEIFKSYLQENGYNYALVRLYEASLFLSMLPYHMDQPGKVFGFLLNAIKILDEVETCTKD